MPVVTGALGMVTKETNKHVNKIPGSPFWYEIKELHLAELLIFLGSTIYVIAKQHPKQVTKL